MAKQTLLFLFGTAVVSVPLLFAEARVAEAFPIAHLPSPFVQASAPQAVDKEQPMARDAHPGFLVATIKSSDPDSTNGGFPTDGHRISCYNVTLADILSVAYGIHAKQIVNAPAWVSHDKYDIAGVPDTPGVPNLVQMRDMYQKLLADRFHLVFRREVRDLPIYAITVAKGGPKLVPAKPDGIPNTGNRGNSSQRTLVFRNMSMGDFILNMNFYEQRPVIDQTSLPGRYDFTLSWTFDDALPRGNDAAPSLVTAMKEQLGLKMEAVKGPAEVFVIDDVSRPSAN